MHIKKTRHTFSDGTVKTQITLVESYRPGKGMNPRTRTIKDYGYLEDQKDPEKFLADLNSYVQEQRQSNQKISLSIDMDKLINDPSNRDLNYSPFVLKQLYDQLNIPAFFAEHRHSRAKYDLNSILCYLTCMKIVFPDSKRATYMDLDHIFGMDASFNLQDIYQALDEICDLRVELQQHLQREVNKMYPADSSYLYLDITNTYFEKDFAEEGALGQKGVSKDHKTEPIVQQGLLLDSNTFPLYHECFPGNTSDSLMLRPMVEKVKEHKMVTGKIIVVADKGLNSVLNIDYLCNQGDGYVFSQVLKGKKGRRFQERLFNESLYTVSKDGQYKWQLYEDTFDGHDSHGKKMQRKCKVLLYWSAADAIVARKKREEKVKRALKALENNAYTTDHSKEKYLKIESVDPESGEILKHTDSIKSINQEKIDEDAKFDGYFCIITSEMDYDEKKMRAVYHMLWMIENTFRLEKTDQGMRPIYVRLDDHIRAHFMIGHLATLITRLIQHKMTDNCLSPERIQRVFQNCVLDIPASGVIHLHEISQKKEFESFMDEKNIRCYSLKETGNDEVFEDYKLLCKALGFELKKAYMRQEDFVRNIKKSTLIPT